MLGAGHWWSCNLVFAIVAVVAAFVDSVGDVLPMCAV
jgi:hypothetical protein